MAQFSLAQVYAALTYYHANREQIESALADDADVAGVMASRHTTNSA
jgi:hypothetical protein